MRRKYLQWAVFVLVIVFMYFFANFTFAETNNQYIVKLKCQDNCHEDSLKSQTFLKTMVRSFHLNPSLYVLELDEKQLEEISKDPNVQYIEPNITLYALQNEIGGIKHETHPEAWGVRKIGADRLHQHGLTGNQDLVIAVIDTGVDYNHEALKEFIYTNPGETGLDENGNDKATNGIDDDGNGFIDDVRGWNFVKKNNDPNDDNNHGTHCAGIITGATIGISPGVKILPLKFLSAGGSGSLADALESIQYATKLKVDIMNNSWGGGGFSQSLFDAIKKAEDEGILFVAAAGNESNNNDNRPAYPASYKINSIISVASTTSEDELSSFSNFGKTSVHVAAPGSNIYSTVKSNEYRKFSGTSMACPAVSGAAALLLTLRPNLTLDQIKEILIASKLENATTETVSGGVLDVEKAVWKAIWEY
jgi:subtilisin family serine protease